MKNPYTNPYANGRKTSTGHYEQLYDPTVDYTDHRESPQPYQQYPMQSLDSSVHNPFASTSAQHPAQHPAPSYDYGDHTNSMRSIGAQRVPSYREFQQQRNYAMPEPEIDNTNTHISPPAHEAIPTPWDASAVGEIAAPEVRLIDRPAEAASSYRPGPYRRPSFANSIRKYFDPESQSTQLRRSNTNRTFFGRESVDEYADDEEVDHQIPISGDEYQLNTWETTSSYSRPSRGPPNIFEDYSAEQDLSHGYERTPEMGFSPSQQLQPWAEENEESIAEKDEQDEGKEFDSSFEGEEDEKGLRTIELFRGNLVLDCPVSTQLLQKYPEHRPVREFTHMRYTAATCEPMDFQSDQYTLRQMCYTQPRQTELFICVTIYNEDDLLLARTLQGVFNNIRHLCHRDRSSTWGPEGWKKVVVCVVADGRNKLNPRAKALMAALGAYQEGFAKNMVNDKAVQAHIYEYTSMVRISKVSEKEGVKLTTEKATPVQLMFCMKEQNKKKINSHRWFFQAFSDVLNPNICVLLDAGTRPGNHAIYHLWKSFSRNPRVAGACGEIAAMLGPGGRKLVNPIVAAQNFEYKMSNILDKPSESMFGFITVLPGAFSAYRYAALQNHPNGTGPLEKYFKGEKLEGKGGVLQANMYLAEDRILCWELVAKRNADWLLTYVKAAKAHTDVPDRLPEFVHQRRRWLNGAFFAQVYSLAHCFSIWRSGHSIGRKLALHIQFLYQLITLTFSWFSLANFFLVFHILSSALGDPSAGFAPGKILGIVLSWIYAACILTVFILSFGNRPQGTKRMYDLIVVFFCLMMAYMIFCTIYISVKGIEYAICANSGFEPKLLVTNSTFRDLIISLLATYALYTLISALFMDPWHIITSMLQYLLLSPAYVNVLNVYAFCNTHDISWGTKGDTAQKLDLGVVHADDSGKLELELPTRTDQVDKYYLDEVSVLSTPPEPDVAPKPSANEKKEDYYALFRSVNVLIWVLMNLALVGVVLNVGGFQGLIGLDDKNNDDQSSSRNGAAGAGTAGAAGTAKYAVKHLVSRASSNTCKEISTGGSTISKVYMAVVFWSVAAMAAYRFILSIAYLFKCLFRRV